MSSDKPLESRALEITTSLHNQNNLPPLVDSQAIFEQTPLVYNSAPSSQVHESCLDEEIIAVHTIQAEAEVDKPTAEEAQQALWVIMKYFELHPTDLCAGEYISLEKILDHLHGKKE